MKALLPNVEQAIIGDHNLQVSANRQLLSAENLQFQSQHFCCKFSDYSLAQKTRPARGLLGLLCCEPSLASATAALFLQFFTKCSVSNMSKSQQLLTKKVSKRNTVVLDEMPGPVDETSQALAFNCNACDKLALLDDRVTSALLPYSLFCCSSCRDEAEFAAENARYT